MAKLFNVKLCAECDELVELNIPSCPSCTCTGFIPLSRILNMTKPATGLANDTNNVSTKQAYLPATSVLEA